jgi:hypothetical protein
VSPSSFLFFLLSFLFLRLRVLLGGQRSSSPCPLTSWLNTTKEIDMPITSKELKLKVLTHKAKLAYYEVQEAKRVYEKAEAEERKAMRELVEYITRK